MNVATFRNLLNTLLIFIVTIRTMLWFLTSSCDLAIDFILSEPPPRHLLSGGTGASFEELIVIPSGYVRPLYLPIFGWSPRPRKRPGGSTLIPPTWEALQPRLAGSNPVEAEVSNSFQTTIFFTQFNVFSVLNFLEIISFFTAMFQWNRKTIK